MVEKIDEKVSADETTFTDNDAVILMKRTFQPEAKALSNYQLNEFHRSIQNNPIIVQNDEFKEKEEELLNKLGRLRELSVGMVSGRELSLGEFLDRETQAIFNQFSQTKAIDDPGPIPKFLLFRLRAYASLLVRNSRMRDDLAKIEADDQDTIQFVKVVIMGDDLMDDRSLAENLFLDRLIKRIRNIRPIERSGNLMDRLPAYIRHILVKAHINTLEELSQAPLTYVIALKRFSYQSLTRLYQFLKREKPDSLIVKELDLINQTLAARGEKFDDYNTRARILSRLKEVTIFITGQMEDERMLQRLLNQLTDTPDMPFPDVFYLVRRLIEEGKVDLSTEEESIARELYIDLLSMYDIRQKRNLNYRQLGRIKKKIYRSLARYIFGALKEPMGQEAR
ncbi:hypothetical protein HY612_05425 [Candidatus Roizmanbacteria bacterium]|nr:hypothetical protein [Candidatus Roizmanbacteria bacterium]